VIHDKLHDVHQHQVGEPGATDGEPGPSVPTAWVPRRRDGLLGRLSPDKLRQVHLIWPLAYEFCSGLVADPSREGRLAAGGPVDGAYRRGYRSAGVCSGCGCRMR
jgi:hypothetical protein